MERLALHADVNRYQRVQSHSRLPWRLLRLWRTTHAHLLELLGDALYTLLYQTRSTLSRVGRLRRLVSSLRRTVLRLTVAWLLSRGLCIWIAVRRLLWHAI